MELHVLEVGVGELEARRSRRRRGTAARTRRTLFGPAVSALRVKHVALAAVQAGCGAEKRATGRRSVAQSVCFGRLPAHRARSQRTHRSAHSHFEHLQHRQSASCPG